MKCMRKSALYLWCLGLALVTFDLLFTFEEGGFTVKSYYFLFLGAAGIFWLDSIRQGTFWGRLAAAGKSPWVFAFLLFLFELGRSPFSFLPKKSFAYSLWLLFDLLVVALPGYYLLREAGAEARRGLFRALLSANFFLVAVLVIDLIAFQYGYIGGLVGYNQEPSLMWGMSRAHAYSYEPSYLAVYFAFSLLLFCGEIFSPARVVSRLPLSLACLALALGIFLLGSRTGWLTTALGLGLLFLALAKRIGRREIMALGGGVLALAVAILIFLPAQQTAQMKKNLVNTLMQGKDGSSNTRLQAMGEAVNMLTASKGLGVGVGASFHEYISRNPQLVTPALNTSQGSEFIMSIWGQLTAESGVAGIGLFFAFGLALCWKIALNLGSDPARQACLISAALFFLLTAHLIGNVARTDVWVWFTIWAALCFGEQARV